MSSKPLVPCEESADEKTPVSPFVTPIFGTLRNSVAPRPGATRLSHLPVKPRSSKKDPSWQFGEPSVVVDPGISAEPVVDSQSDTVYLARRRYARKLQLAFVSTVCALLAAAITLWLAQLMGVGKSPAAEPGPASGGIVPSKGANAVASLAL